MAFLLGAFLLIGSACSYTRPVAPISSSIRLAAVKTSKPTGTIAAIDAPDFYWEHQLKKLVRSKEGELSFKASNYEVTGSKNLFDAYYLDLTLQGKLDGYDWASEKKLSESEWLTIYKSICEWSSKTVKEFKPTTANLPANDFDLLQEFYPQLNFRELETPFTVDEVGANFQFANMKELLSAAAAGPLKIPGFEAVTSLECAGLKADLAKLKKAAMEKVDALYADTLAYAKNPFPDAESKAHYQKLRATLAGFPQTKAEWTAFRATTEKEVDEMAKLASKEDDSHHHHHEEEEHGEPKLSVAEEFQAKYGRSLEEMQERMNEYKSNPEGFVESSILKKFGRAGLDIWNKSQEFSAQFSVMSEADRTAAEESFASFLKSA